MATIRIDNVTEFDMPAYDSSPWMEIVVTVTDGDASINVPLKMSVFGWDSTTVAEKREWLIDRGRSLAKKAKGTREWIEPDPLREQEAQEFIGMEITL